MTLQTPIPLFATADGLERSIEFKDAGGGVVALAVNAERGPISLRIPLHPGEHVVGFGEQFVELGQRGRSINGWIDSALHADDRSSYFVAPIYHSSRGYALHIDTLSHWTADVGSRDRDWIQFTVPDSSLQAYVCVGSPARALDALTARIGRPAIPPEWAFSPWAAARSGTDAVLAEADRLIAERIPVGVMWVDDYYDRATNSGAGICFPYPRGSYDNLRRLTDALRQRGLRALGYINCVLYRGTPRYDEALAQHLAVRNSEGIVHHFRFFHPEHQDSAAERDEGIVMEDDVAALLNMEDPRARQLWGATIRRMIAQDGWDGWMQDFGEQHPDERSHNLYPLLYHRATADEIRALGRDTNFFVRSAALGSQADAPIMWGGDRGCDWSPDRGLPSLIPAGISAGLSGVAVWCPDIAGLIRLPTDEDAGDQDEELWIRWMQFGALSPIMRVHLGFKDGGGVGVNCWTSKQTTTLFRRFAELHERLRPYLIAKAQDAALTGMPILRAMLLEFPEDLECWSLGHQYMLGEALLVAPVVEKGARERRLYLPNGIWRNVWSGAVISGPGWVTVPAPLEEIPLFARCGTPSPV